MTAQRGTCRTCGREFALTKRGRLRWHMGWRNVGVHCNGSGARPVKP